MNGSPKFAPRPDTSGSRREELLARLEASLREEASLQLVEDGPGGIDPYNTLQGPKRRDAWGPRAR